MSTFVLCVGCGEPLYGFSPYRWCTCERCGIDMLNGICPLCHLSNLCAYDHNQNSFNCPPDSYPPPHPTYETYSGDTCGTCGNDSHFGYDCPPQFPLNYEPEPGYIQNYNSYPHDSPSFPQQYLCCEDCRVTHEPYQCQPKNHDYYHEQNSCYDSNSIGFDQSQPQQYTVNHPIFDANHDLLGSQKKLNITLTKVTEQMTSMCEMACQIVQKNLEKKQLEEEQAVKAQNWKLLVCYDDDDDEESSNYLEDNIISELPPYSAVTPTEPIDSLSMGNEHLNTILATESDEFIKSSVKNLVPNLSESEGESECDSTSDEDFPKKIYSNPLFDEEIIPMEIDQHPFNVESDLIESMPNHDSSITISSKIDSLFDEFAEKWIEEEQAAKAQSWKLPVCYDDDDDEEGYNSLNDNIISELPPYSAVTPSEPIDSLSMGDEHLNTISVTESDEFIKSCVENLVPNPSESEGENECDVPAGFTTFSNVLFDNDYDSNSSDDQSLSDEDVPEKIYSNPLFDEEIIPMEIDHHSFNAESDLIKSMPNHDSSIIISSKIDFIFDENAGELTILKSIPSGIDETDCHLEKEIRLAKRLLYDNSSPRPPEEIVSDNSNAYIESFSPSPILNLDSDPLMEEIDLSFNPDDPMPSGIEDDDYDSRRDISILEELLDNYSLSLPNTESYHFDIPSPYRPPAKPPDGNTRTLNIKMMGDVSDRK
nr:hypothetical protein [Tanacetum cinerariifolium]